MSLVIDDRLKVWDEYDQPRVHVVPAFAPYYAPQAEVYFVLFYMAVLCKLLNSPLPLLFLSSKWLSSDLLG